MKKRRSYEQPVFYNLDFVSDDMKFKEKLKAQAIKNEKTKKDSNFNNAIDRLVESGLTIEEIKQKLRSEFPEEVKKTEAVKIPLNNGTTTDRLTARIRTKIFNNEIYKLVQDGLMDEEIKQQLIRKGFSEEVEKLESIKVGKTSLSKLTALISSQRSEYIKEEQQKTIQRIKSQGKQTVHDDGGR